MENLNIREGTKFFETNYFCIATTLERIDLWKRFSKEYLELNRSLLSLTEEQKNDLGFNNKFNWEQDYNSDYYIIGCLDIKTKLYIADQYVLDEDKNFINESYESYKKHEVFIIIDYYLINGVRVGFIKPCSRFVDNSMISDFLNFNNKKKIEAINFSHYLFAIDEINKKDK